MACLSVASVLASDPPPEPTLPELAAFLGARSGARIELESIVWEPKRNALAELALGRRVLFLAAPPNGGPRELYRAAVRLTPSGQPLAVSNVTNLSETPDADELALSLGGGVATFATAAAGNIRAVSALAIDGARIERTDILIEVPAREATLARDAHSLSVRFPAHDDEIRYDFARRELTGEPAKARVVHRSDAPRGLVLALTDGARGWLGETPTGALASLTYGVRDAVERALYSVAHVGRRPEPRATLRSANVVDARSARRPEDVWPPPRVPTVFAPDEPDEGVYRTLVKRGAEPCLYRTFVRPDPLRPYSRAVLVALDMRQLELELVAGRDVPKPSAGPPDDGRLPRDAKALERLVAVFSAGRTSRGDRFGMQARGRLLTPVEPGAIAIAELARGETLIGPWPFGAGVPEEVVAFRQGLDALLDAGGKPRASETRSDRDVRARSGLCATRAGHLYYAFGERLDRDALASTFARAGCGYAVELGGGAEPAGIALAKATGSGSALFTPVEPSMTFDAERALHGSSRDFVAISLRDAKPREPGGADWRPDRGTQPLPGWITGVFRTSVSLGGLAVELYSFETGRVEWRLRPGVREPGAKGEAWAGFLPEGDAERALATFELGHTTVRPRLGLALGTTTPITLKDTFATLVLAPTKPPLIIAPGETTKFHAEEQAVQLPLLADADGVSERARERGDLRMRSALGVTRSGRVLVALSRHDSSDPLAVALKDAGAERVVELDRGSRHPAFVHRAGTAAPPQPSYDSTTLWALARPMLPGARITKLEE